MVYYMTNRAIVAPFLSILVWRGETPHLLVLRDLPKEEELPAPPHLLSADGKQELYFRTSKKETMLDVLSGSSPCGWWP